MVVVEAKQKDLYFQAVNLYTRCGLLRFVRKERRCCHELNTQKNDFN